MSEIDQATAAPSAVATTVSDIIQAAGGAPAIAKAAPDRITTDMVYKWPKIGIPDRHWDVIMTLAPSITAHQLYEANLAARGLSPETSSVA